MSGSKYFIAFSTTCFILGLSGCATGGSGSNSPMTGRASSKSDRAARADDLFTVFDANADGYLTRSELDRGLRSAATTWEPNPNLMNALGPDAPKKKSKPRPLSDAQVKRAIANAFKSHDKKLDDRISRDEFKKVVADGGSNAEQDPWAPFM